MTQPRARPGYRAVVDGSWLSRLAVLALLVLALAGCARETGESVQGHAGALRQVSCWFDNHGANPAVCGWLRPSLQDSTDSTELPVVIVRELPRQPSERAVIFLNGGPGADTGLDEEGLRHWRMHRARLELRHDLVLYDQRGAGRAVPDVSCPGLNEAARRSLGDGNDHAFPIRAKGFAEAVIECAQEIPLADRRSALYSTATAVEDLRELIVALKAEFGYSSILLYGVSYGARLAVMAAQQPDHGIDGMVLDSMYVPGSGAMVLYPQELEALLDEFDQLCFAYDCDLPDGGIRTSLRAAVEQLHERPMRARAADPDRPGGRLDLRIEAGDLIGLLLTTLYVHDWLYALPGILDDLVHDDLDEDWQSMLDNAVWMSLKHGVNYATYVLIDCRDNERLDPRTMEAQLERYPLFKDLLRPEGWEYTYCDRLAVPAAPLPADWRVEVPSLLLNMAMDPATPAYKVEAALDRFDDGELVIVPGSGHGVLDYDDDVARQAGWFLNGEPMPEPPWQPQMCPPPGGEPFTA